MSKWRRVVGGAVVVAFVIVLARAVGWAQQQPRPKLQPVAVPTPAVPVPPRTRALPLHLVVPQAPQAAPLHTVRAMAIPTPPTGGFGVVSSGTAGGGRFFDADGGAEAWLGSANFGIQAFGNTGGGYFKDSDHSGYAYVGEGNYGILAYGNTGGGYFRDSDHSGYAYVGYGDRGINALGDEMGGYFKDSDHSGYAYIGYSDTGIWAGGNTGGGYLWDILTSAFALVGADTYKIVGIGAVSFVQNHPVDPGAVIVYAAPEGDEVATYTRGTARLVGGEAHVALGDTFKWVTNPDIGLTAYLTPVGGWCDLYVAEKGTSELVVRSRDGSDCTFDYMAYGLRIGFEETTVVQEKQQQSYIPAMRNHRELLARRPDLARYTALARYSAGRQAMGITEPLKLERANALKAAIHEFDPAVDRIEAAGLPHQQPAPPSPAPGVTSNQGEAAPSYPLRPQVSGEPQGNGSSGGVVSVTAEQDLHARSFSSPREQLATRVAVAGSVGPGDVLVVDRERPEFFVRGERPADPAVVGVVVADAGVALGATQSEGSSAPVALSGIARCKVDASFGAIAPGDLLVSSPTPGHAMREDSPLPGTVVGKALEPLASGQGVIRILVMPR